MRGGARMHQATYTSARTPAYTDSHCNKVILWPAQVNKVQQRECDRSRGKLSAGEGETKEAEDRSTHRQRNGKTERARKMEPNLSVNITRGAREEKWK